ncbi:pantoate--beta-alanine ligase [uncultured Cytophaga sp.]|uniref:pantoate--beta-alanine ligase n=1 Tax=uncultured Cytophaga sp. TaxID=160238 RepID=UPI0026338609|nr:pantoate--beta-alanine ligase [uncultured Cytophaga sp.]
MICIRSILALRLHIDKEKQHSRSIGFVPTMGALHEGHISLIKQAKNENAVCIASIFVNPLQFNNVDDFNKYPIQHEADILMMEQAGCDILFMPDVQEFYPIKPQISIDMGALDRILEGAHRPGHFSGVAIVVTKLFHAVSPTKAYFGQKDLQQVAVINQLVRELNFPIQVVSCPIIRESNGLAMSSRNMRLTEQGRLLASNLFIALSHIKEAIIQGEQQVEKAQNVGKDYLKKLIGIELEYLEIVNSTTLEPLSSINTKEGIAICIAAHIEGVRLIDNVVIIS